MQGCFMTPSPKLSKDHTRCVYVYFLLMYDLPIIFHTWFTRVLHSDEEPFLVKTKNLLTNFGLLLRAKMDFQLHVILQQTC